MVGTCLFSRCDGWRLDAWLAEQTYGWGKHVRGGKGTGLMPFIEPSVLSM